MLMHSCKGLQCHVPLCFVASLKYGRFCMSTSSTPTIGNGSRRVLTVSKTQGTPSTSTDLKEALWEKIPLHYDLVRKLRNQYGPEIVSQITVDDIYRGLSGINTIVRETSETDPNLGLKYRGLSLPEVLTILPRNGASPYPEAVFWLLLTGDVPTEEQTASLIADLKNRRQKRREWWLEPGGSSSVVGSVLRSLPENVTPIGRLSVALMSLDNDKYIKEALKNGALSYTHWEYVYEDSMELLAALPAIVGHVSKKEDMSSISEEGDWVDFLLDSLSSKITENVHINKKALGDFLRLYIALNADEDGGVPGAHVTQILGNQLDANHTLASGTLAYATEPRSGTMLQYMDFQKKLKDIFGKEPRGDALKSFIISLVDRENTVTGFKETSIRDSRYGVLKNFAREHLPEDPDIELSRMISQVTTTSLKRERGREFNAEQNILAGPIFQLYGLKDMEFNQVLLCMSRALGAIASMIWARAMAMEIPAEHPRSKCTYTFVDFLQDSRKRTNKNLIRAPKSTSHPKK